MKLSPTYFSIMVAKIAFRLYLNLVSPANQIKGFNFVANSCFFTFLGTAFENKK